MSCGNGTLASGVPRKVPDPPMATFRRMKKFELKIHCAPFGRDDGVAEKYMFPSTKKLIAFGDHSMA